MIFFHVLKRSTQSWSRYLPTDDEIAFLVNEIPNGHNTISVKIKDYDAVLRFITQEGYPKTPMKFSMSGPFEGQTLLSVHALGRQIAERQANSLCN